MRWKLPKPDGAAMKVLIPSALQSYTAQALVEASGATVAEVLIDLERQYPGIRFRMVDEHGQLRRHMRIFHDGQAVCELAHVLRQDARLNIVLALSGG
jgi:molybdopterin converting factor small subunit